MKSEKIKQKKDGRLRERCLKHAIILAPGCNVDAILTMADKFQKFIKYGTVATP